MDPEFTEMCRAAGIDPIALQRAYLERRIREIREQITAAHDAIVTELMAEAEEELPTILAGKWPR